MEFYSEKMQYEKALEYKQLLDNVNITLEKQKVELDDNVNRDVVGYYTESNYLSVQILFIRGGKLLDRKRDIFPMVDTLEEELVTYLSHFYDKHQIKPKEVLTPEEYNFIVTPKEIDELIEKMKDIIARGINFAVN